MPAFLPPPCALCERRAADRAAAVLAARRRPPRLGRRARRARRVLMMQAGPQGVGPDGLREVEAGVQSTEEVDGVEGLDLAPNAQPGPAYDLGPPREEWASSDLAAAAAAGSPPPAPSAPADLGGEEPPGLGGLNGSAPSWMNSVGREGIADRLGSMEGVDYVGGMKRVESFSGRPLDAEREPIRITSLRLQLTGPSNISLMRYMNDLCPKIDYLEPKARERVLSALEVANVAHEGQKRKSGEPFIVHPIAVASILAEMKMDRDSIIAGLLHDTVEDTPVTLEELEGMFGRDVRKIVEGETKFSKLAKKVQCQKAAGKRAEELSARARDPVRPLTAWEFRAQEDALKEEEQQKQADNLRNMFLAMTEDVRVIIVKLADRLHNLRTLQYMPVAKQKKISKETLEFFTPLAHRLGMSRIKTELEELSFKFLYPEEYRSLSGELLSMHRRLRTEDLLADVSKSIKEMLVTDGILKNMVKHVDVKGTQKPIYTIHRRTRKGIPLHSMLDIATIQVVVDLDSGINSNQACYHALGRIHSRWKPLPKRFKDYIAFPKPNGYQCLHTTVLVDQRFEYHPLEVHICTKEMYRIAEEGVAAELFQNASNLSAPQNGSLLSPSSSESRADNDDAFPTNRRPDEEWKKRTKRWLISIREYIQDFSSSRDLVDAVRRDLLGNRVFVFTPKGTIVDLPNESTPVDLAYRIHTEIGHRMIGAKVNGRMVSLDYKLQNADSVKIITSASSTGPSSEWMGYAKSRTARQKIRQFLRARDRDNMIERGRLMLRDAAKARLEPVPSEAAISETLPRLSAVLTASWRTRSIRSIDDLYIAIARGVTVRGPVPLEQIILSILRNRRNSVFANSAPHDSSSADDLELHAPPSYGYDEGKRAGEKPVVELATCCHPLRGDQVMGVYTDNKVVVHRLQCNHMLSVLRERPINPRVVGVRWMAEGPSWLPGTDPMPLHYNKAGLNAQEESVIGSLGRPCQPGCIVVTARDCDGLLSYMSGIIAGLGKSIRRSLTITDPLISIATLAFEILVEDVHELEKVMEQIVKCDEVKSVRRVGPNERSDFFPPEPAGISKVHRDQSRVVEIIPGDAGVDLTRQDGENGIAGEKENREIWSSDSNYRVAALRCQQRHQVLRGEVEIDELDLTDDECEKPYAGGNGDHELLD